MKTKWLDRRISAPGPYLCLCLSKKECAAAFKDIGVAPTGNWIKTPQANATVHYITSSRGLVCVVCMTGWENRNPIEVAGLLVHEAVHVWQEWCDYYGEHAPAREQEAYAVQGISQELMAEFARRMENG